ncbi:prion-inhibition and propagation-domain-containing protein [Calycina marina]|uniref:Prion-inhibition and propagation-domain-containing protein n=1 Tax=Calycina marina TaxID=1763456 RepID=A0A9P7ZBZ5_9HELO|nr:prion-inhibition and propagation-domain-containing protein [Calycina marina]
MAEAAGLVLGGVSVVSLFSSCIELAEYVDLARNLGPDYEAAYTKFLLLRSRLIASGSKLQLVLAEQATHASSERCEFAAARSLVAIKGLLENVGNLEQKYGLRQEGKGGKRLRELQRHHSSTLQEVERALQDSVGQRQQKMGLGRRIVWAIRDKKAFDGLIANLAFHIDELENLVVRSSTQTLQTVLPSFSSHMSASAIQLLETASSEPDMNRLLESRTEETYSKTASKGHLYLRNQIMEYARVLQGDVGGDGTNGRCHTFMENLISGEAKVVQGNVSHEFMESFWDEGWKHKSDSLRSHPPEGYDLTSK